MKLQKLIEMQENVIAVHQTTFLKQLFLCHFHKVVFVSYCFSVFLGNSNIFFAFLTFFTKQYLPL